MAATVLTAIASFQKVLFGEYHIAFGRVVVLIGF